MSFRPQGRNLIVICFPQKKTRHDASLQGISEPDEIAQRADFGAVSVDALPQVDVFCKRDFLAVVEKENNIIFMLRKTSKGFSAVIIFTN